MPRTTAHPELIPLAAPPRCAPAGSHSPVTRPAGDLLSAHARKVLGDRFQLEKMVTNFRNTIRFHERPPLADNAGQEIAWNRAQLAEAVNTLALFDLEHLTDECRAHLDAKGEPYTYNTSSLRKEVA